MFSLMVITFSNKGAYSQPSQISKMDLREKVVNVLTIYYYRGHNI